MLSALKHRDFRNYWLGLAPSILAYQIVLMVAQPWLVYELTGSARDLGILGLASALPTLALNPLGGLIADKLDQRRLLALVQTVAAILFLAQALLVVFRVVEVWHIWAISLALSAVTAFDFPTRMTLMPRLVPRGDMTNAIALNTAVWQSSRIVGPPIGGFLIAKVGVASCFYLGTAGALAFVVAIALLRRVPAPTPTGPRRSWTGEMAEGLSYIRASGLIRGLMLLTFFNSFFGMSFIFLLPIYAKDILRAGPEGLGILYAASGAGALLSTLAVANMGNLRRPSTALVTSAVVSGLLTILFAFSVWYVPSLLLMFLTGAASAVYMVITMSTIQLAVADHLRGRVMGVFSSVWSMIPLGGAQAGFVASAISAPFAVALGGAAVTVSTLVIAARNHSIRSLGTAPGEASLADERP